MSLSVGVSGWERPKQVFYLHLHAWRHATTLELHSGVMNVAPVREDMFSHLLIKELLRGNMVGFGAESAPKFRGREGKWSRRKQSAGRNGSEPWGVGQDLSCLQIRLAY